MTFTANSALLFDIVRYADDIRWCIPYRLKKSLVTFAENSGPTSDDISTGTAKVTKVQRKVLHSPFEPESLVPNLILCCSF